MTRVARLTVVLVFNLALVAGLVIVGIAAHSVGVLAEGGDYLIDAAAIAVSLLAIWLSGRPVNPRRPLGYRRATAVAAVVNAGWLLVLELLVLAVALDRLATGTPQVHGLAVLVASGVAGAVMVFGALILRGDAGGEADSDGDRLNMRAVLLDTVADAAAAAGVAAAGLVILATSRFYWLDPTVAAVIALIVAYRALTVATHAVTAFRAPSRSNS